MEKTNTASIHKVLFLFLVTCTLFQSKASIAQGARSAYIEVAGNGIGISGNFDMRLKRSENGFGFRAGIGLYPGTDFNPSFLTIPVGINHLTGKKQHHFESGIGVTILPSVKAFRDNDFNASAILIVPSLGYRYAKQKKGFVGRIFISPLYIPKEGTGLFYFGLSGGFKF